ncbi:flagellar basal-body MS-ring/collar protein FliF [Salipiger sp. IMCC34102]|uniref:flagellar basal-body MS-ring/collar protein FliF n=1 Tax=Salipiger sp. IMCC34102 TaxID=2510647 RepID=UPI0013EA9E79|nr:flagellar basal-body MS-ring/collar protein FliF [Salipiger sp. IMCC34102]
MTVWTKLGPTRRLVAVGATVIVFLAVLLLARSAGQRDMTLLFGGLEPAAAGDVLTALDQRGVRYDVRGGSIYVDAAERDSLRMALAGEGLPATGTKGYELLDNLSGFGTTSQMFDAAYWRAREGELARTILSSPAIRAARVHISTPGTQRFQRDAAPTAAVTVTTTQGAMSAQQVRALQYLVASAVTGLQPEGVAIIDDMGGLLSGGEDLSVAAGGDSRADLLRRRAERLLEARVGAGNAVVEVSIDTVTASEQIVERTVDPDSRIAISTDVTENSSNAQDTAGGAVTVASNVPDGDAEGGGSSAQDSESRVLTNYEISQTERQIVKAPGDVKRLTVAVLVNDRLDINPDGTTAAVPRTPEELEDMTELVASAVGLDEGRGDVITLRSMSFGPQPVEGTAGVVPGLIRGGINLMQIIQIAIAAVVALVLGLFVVRPILAPNRNAEALPPPGPGDASMMEGGGEVFDSAPSLEEFRATNAGGGGFGNVFDAPQEPEALDPVARLRSMIEDRQTETVQILQDWMERPEGETS